MPRRNKVRKEMMRCATCQCRIPSSYAKVHIGRCQRADRQRKSTRHTKYSKGS